MKRSRMLEQGALFLQECLERDKFSYAETMDALLDYLEIEGMRPPLHRREFIKTDVFGYKTTCYEGVLGWEPEGFADDKSGESFTDDKE